MLAIADHILEFNVQMREIVDSDEPCRCIGVEYVEDAGTTVEKY